MKKLFISMCLISFLGLCNASECLRFVVDDNIYLQFEKEDVNKLSPNVDAVKNHIVELYLTEKGQVRLKEFTEKYIGEYIAVYLGEQQVWKSVKITTPIEGSSKINIRAEDEYISDILMSCK